MKTSVISASVLFVLLFACNKENLKPASSNTSSVDEATASKTPAQLLVAHPWMYKGFYLDYVDHNNKGNAEYVRDSSNNDINLDKTKIIFKADGTLIKHENNGYTYTGTWSFTNNADTTLFLNFTTWTETGIIVHFTSSHLNYTEAVGYHSKSYTELIPPPFN